MKALTKRLLRLCMACLFFPLLNSAAFAQMPNNLNKVLVGTWNAKSFNNNIFEASGDITFYPDGTFQINGGVMSVVIGCQADFTGAMGTWSIIEDTVIKMTLNGVDPAVHQPYSPAYPFVINFDGHRLSLVRSSNNTLLIKAR